MIALLGRWYDRLAQRVGQTMAGAVVLALALVVWLVLAWILGDWWVRKSRPGPDTGFETLQYLAPGWFFPKPVSDLGDEAVSSRGEPGAVYMWRRGDVVLYAWMFRDRGSSFDHEAAARGYADELDQRATAD
jgi:hypothetical protein